MLGACRAPKGVRSAAQSTCEALWAFRQSNELAILLSHEAFTGMTADLTAQAIEGRHEGTLPPPRHHRRHLIDWVRVARTTMVSLLSDDLPFLAWSRALWSLAEQARAAVLASSLPRPLVAFLASPAFVTVGKTAVTQLFYETTSDSAYLAMQAGLRGESMAAELKAKLWTLRKDALVYWSAAHIFVFSMPVWWLQPIADNTLTLVFNVYQSLLAHRQLGETGQPSWSPPAES